jgi:hypothetical protein
MMGCCYDLPPFWMVRRDSRNNRAPRWMSQCRRGLPIRLEKNDSRKMEKRFWRHFFGDFSRYLNKLHSYHSDKIEAAARHHKSRTEDFGHENRAACRGDARPCPLVALRSCEVVMKARM